MQITLRKLLKEVKDEKAYFKDIHILRFFSSYVIISDKRVIKVTDPYMAYCPLASFLYKNVGQAKNLNSLKKAITESIDGKISKFGHFTEKRELSKNDIAIPYGASEILMYAMRKKYIDASVVVCGGAGTVIVDKPEIVQGIGARMNGVFYTSPISGIIKKLKKENCHVVFRNASINQIKGVEKAAHLGYKNIAVTINACMTEPLDRLREIERDYKVFITSLMVCTTGVAKKRIHEMKKYADIVWSCGSEEVRKSIGSKAVLQISKKIPVFVLTKKGLDLVSNYSSDRKVVKNLDLKKQYIIASDYKGKEIKMGDFESRLNEAKLPIRHKKEPVLNAVQS